MKTLHILCASLLFACGAILIAPKLLADGDSPHPPPAEEAPPTVEPPPTLGEPEPEPTKKSIGHHIIMYLPNRIFDVLDIVRAKVGLGPGIAAGVRVTDYIDIWAGAQTTTWVGLPGPRREPLVPMPVGIDTRGGAEVSALEAVEAPTQGTHVYAPDEIGVHVHAVIAGAEVGVSMQEALDAVFGFLFIDIVGDDL